MLGRTSRNSAGGLENVSCSIISKSSCCVLSSKLRKSQNGCGGALITVSGNVIFPPYSGISGKKKQRVNISQNFQLSA